MWEKQIVKCEFVRMCLQESGSRKLKTDVDLGCNFYVQAEV